jgi:hypothetical protein
VSYESSLASAWESYSGGGYQYEVDVDDTCGDCEAPSPEGLTVMASLDAYDGEAWWKCEQCGYVNNLQIEWGYVDVAEDKQYDL